MYFIEKYDIRHVYEITYLREDLNQPHSFENRVKLMEYDAWKKVFECYRKQADIIENKKVASEHISKIKEEKPLNKQIDLLEMIAEVEQEIKKTEG